MKIRGLTAIAIACLVIGIGAASVQAAGVNSFLQNGFNEASDNDAEYLVVDSGNDGILGLNDVIVGGISINSLNDTNANIGGGTTNDQWSGVFAIQVRAILNPNAVTGTADILFQPWGGFSAYLATLDTDPGTAGQQAPAGIALAAGTMARLWTNPTATANFNNNPAITGGGSALVHTGTAAAGTFYWDLGFSDPTAASYDDGTSTGTSGSGITSDDGEGWVALNGGLDIGALQTSSPGTKYNPGNFGLTVLQAGGFGLGPFNFLLDQSWVQANAFQIGATAGDTVQVIGSSTVKGAAGSTANGGFLAGSETDFTFNLALVPLPGAAWMGMALMAGIGAMRIRRKRRNY